MLNHCSRGLLLLLGPLLVLGGCKKEDDDNTSRPSGGGNTGSTVVFWTPELSITTGGSESTYDASNATFSDDYSSFARDGAHYVLQEAVINAGSQGGQWRIGFVGTFVQPADEPITAQQRASIATLYQHFYGRFLWTGSVQTAQAVDGVRIVHTDAAGVVWTSGYGSQTSGWSFNVSASSPTNSTTGARHQIRATFNCVLTGPPGAGNRSVSGSFQGPLVFN